MSNVNKLDHDEAMILLRDYKTLITKDEVQALSDVAASYAANEPTTYPDSLLIKNKADRRLRSLSMESMQ